MADGKLLDFRLQVQEEGRDIILIFTSPKENSVYET